MNSAYISNGTIFDPALGGILSDQNIHVPFLFAGRLTPYLEGEGDRRDSSRIMNEEVRDLLNEVSFFKTAASGVLMPVPCGWLMTFTFHNLFLFLNKTKPSFINLLSQ